LNGAISISQTTSLHPPGRLQDPKKRFPEISENAIAWLEHTARAAVAWEGAGLLPFSFLGAPEETPRKLEGDRRGEGTVDPARDETHPSARNWLAMHGDINKLVLQSGHDSVDAIGAILPQGRKESPGREVLGNSPAAA